MKTLKRIFLVITIAGTGLIIFLIKKFLFRKEEIISQSNSLDDAQEEAKEKEGSLVVYLEKQKEKLDTIKQEKKERDEKAKKFFPNL